MLINKTKEEKITDKVIVASDFFAKFRGLMFEKRRNFKYALIMDMGFESRLFASVHSFFVFFPITVLFLDKNKKVVDKVLLKPFSLAYIPKKKARYVVELPKEKFNAAETGDTLKW